MEGKNVARQGKVRRFKHGTIQEKWVYGSGPQRASNSGGMLVVWASYDERGGRQRSSQARSGPLLPDRCLTAPALPSGSSGRIGHLTARLPPTSRRAWCILSTVQLP